METNETVDETKTTVAIPTELIDDFDKIFFELNYFSNVHYGGFNPRIAVENRH